MLSATAPDIATIAYSNKYSFFLVIKRRVILIIIVKKVRRVGFCQNNETKINKKSAKRMP